MNTFIEQNKGIFKVVIIFIAVFLVAASLGKLKELKYIGTGVNATNTITVTGKGTVDRTPDTAKISFTVQDEQKSLKAAQDNVTKKIDAITQALKDAGVEEKYVKTDAYNSYPQYDYVNTIRCITYPCPTNNTPVIRGYQVSHNVTVSIKNLDNVSVVLDMLGTNGVTNISGPNFGFEDDTAIAREARDAAIADAKEEAKKLAKSLGVKLVRIVSFSENGGGYPVPMYAMTAKVEDAGGSAPSLPVGEHNIDSIVTLVYEIQ